jgi:RecA-family ATPase
LPADLEPDRNQIEIFVNAVLRYATKFPEGYVAIRAFPQDQASQERPQLNTTSLKAGLLNLIEVAVKSARRAARTSEPMIFSPPVALFRTKDDASDVNVLAGLVLAIDLDKQARAARATLESILGPATLVVRSGGRDQHGEDCLHVYWRLKEPATMAGALARLRQAQEYMVLLVDGDRSGVAVNHPFRWPGSWHRKAEPRLCEIETETLNADIEIDLNAAIEKLWEALGANARARPLPSGKAETADDLLVELALRAIPNNDVEYEDWITVLYASKYSCGGSERGFRAFDAWSRKSSKYNLKQNTRKTWDKAKPRGDVGFGTLAWLAFEADRNWDGEIYADEEVKRSNNGGNGADGGQPVPGQQPKLNDRGSGQANNDKAANGDQARPGADHGTDDHAEAPPEPKSAKKKSTGPAWATTIRRIDISNWDTEPVPEQEWEVPDRIPRHTVGLFSGLGGAGKSLLQLQLSIAKVLQREWLGIVPAPGPALFIDTEDPKPVLHKRAVDIVRYYGASFTELKDSLHLVSWLGEDAVLGSMSRDYRRIMPTKLFEHLLEMVGDLRPGLIGIASSANVFAGNELNREQVQQFIGLLSRLARRCHGSVVLLSHPSLTGITTESGLSGSTQWHNAVRARFYLKSVDSGKDEQPDTNLREIVFLKNNYGPISASIALQYQNGLFLPVEGGNLDAMARLELAKSVFLTLLKRFAQENRNLHVSPGRGYAPSEFAHEQEARDARVNKDDLPEAMRQLLSQGRITNTSYRLGSHEHSRLVIGTDIADEDMPF